MWVCQPAVAKVSWRKLGLGSGFGNSGLHLVSLCRAVGTSVLSDNIQELEGRLDDVKAVCQNTTKRLLACLSGTGGSDFDKRLVRNTCACVLRWTAVFSWIWSPRHSLPATVDCNSLVAFKRTDKRADLSALCCVILLDVFLLFCFYVFISYILVMLAQFCAILLSYGQCRCSNACLGAPALWVK